MSRASSSEEEEIESPPSSPVRPTGEERPTCRVRHKPDPARARAAKAKKRKSTKKRSSPSTSLEASATPSKRSAPRAGQFMVFTANMGTDEGEALRQIEVFRLNVQQLLSRDMVGCLCVGHELAPTTGQHHLQGYFECPEGIKWTFNQLRENLFIGFEQAAWVQAAKGSGAANLRYTTKEANHGRFVFVHGSPRGKGRGKRSDLTGVQAMIDSGSTMVDIYREHFESSARFYRFFEHYRMVTRTPRSWVCPVHYIYGPSGSGKSRRACELAPPGPDVFWLAPPKSGQNVWWDGYQGQATVVIDEYRPGFFGQGHYSFVRQLFDRYPLKVPVHGGLVEFTSRNFVITSNHCPSKIDEQKYSTYPWNATNPMFHRMYLREPRWVFTQIGEYDPYDIHGPDLTVSVPDRDGRSSSANLHQLPDHVSPDHVPTASSAGCSSVDVDVDECAAIMHDLALRGLLRPGEVDPLDGLPDLEPI